MSAAAESTGAPLRGGAWRQEGEDQIFIPWWIIMMLIGLAIVTLTGIALARATGVGLTREAAPIATADVTFRTGPVAEGPIVARLDDGRTVPLAAAHQDIFLRMVLQGITTARSEHNISQDAPLRLLVARDGERVLVDRAAHHVIRLAAFGPENGTVFDALLRTAEARR